MLFRASIPNFLRFLGFIYCIAFGSVAVQALGLIGSHGILPLADYLKLAHAELGREAYRLLPTVLWFHPSDKAIMAVCIAGAVLGAAAAIGIFPRAMLAGCVVLWLSVSIAGQEFFSYQWDTLLLETGFLAIFADTTPVRIFLFRWLLFRVVFFSGVVKLMSGDMAWRKMTALHFHYETQPLPNPVAWGMYQLPMSIHQASTGLTLFSELMVPFLFFFTGRYRLIRHLGAAVTLILQVLIVATGNYGFFNFLTMALVMMLYVERPKPRGDHWLQAPPPPWYRRWTHRIVTAALATFVLTVSGLVCLEELQAPMPPFSDVILHAVAPFRLINSYGLFAVMTTSRPEIVVEGSGDGDTWKAYEFRFKPGDVMRAPPVVAPYQPRLDWQMWFAALGEYRQNPWFTKFMVRLLKGEPAVLQLLASNPFPQAPPKYVRARAYMYHFTAKGERGWWKREERGLYFPMASLKGAEN